MILMNNFWLIVIIIIFVIGAGFVLVRSGDNANINTVEEATQSANLSGKYTEFPGELPEKELTGKNISIETSKGIIEFELFGKDAPKAVSNFIFLTNEGYYNGLTFHRRDEGFVIQGGDPSGDGSGGPGYRFEDETVTKNYDKGIVAMANAGPNTNGSQFFIMLADNDTLPKNFTIFGKVTKGIDVVDKIQVGDVMDKVNVF